MNIYSSKEIENLIQSGESYNLEFKSLFSQDVIETLVAFYNAKGGSVLLGVDDNGDVKGTNHQLLPSEVANLHLQSINSSWDCYANEEISIDDISLDKVQLAIERMQKNKISIIEDPLSFLYKYNLIRDDKPTNAAFLMFKKEDSFDTTIELGRFQNEIVIKDSARSKSDIMTQIDTVMNFVIKHINKKVIIIGSPYNTQKWQYPLEAIREIIINMIIHRDYRSSSDSIVKIFNDKIEFYNPGKLPDDISIDDLINNKYRSVPRNKLVADCCKDMGIIEKYGSGIRRVIDHFKNENLPIPEFGNISEGFMVTVFSKNYGAITETVEKILDIIANNPQITQTGLAEMTGLTRRGVEWNLSQLKAKNIIERIGSDKGGYWKVNI